MAASVLFDTLDYARKLETAGVPAAQAEAQARVLAGVLGHAIASSDDLRVVETNLGSRISAMEAKLDAAVSRLETKIAAVQSGLETKISALESRLDARIDNLGSILEIHKWILGLLVAMSLTIIVRLFAFS